MKKFIVPLAMAFALAGFAPAFAETGATDAPKATTPAPDDGTSTAPKSDEKKDEKGSTGTTTEPAPAPAPDAK